MLTLLKSTKNEKMLKLSRSISSSGSYTLYTLPSLNSQHRSLEEIFKKFSRHEFCYLLFGTSKVDIVTEALLDFLGISSLVQTE